MSRSSFVALFVSAAVCLACGDRDTNAPEVVEEVVTLEEAPAPAAAPGRVDGARIAAADSEPGSWLAHGRTYSEQRFSPLDQIHKGNVGDLGLAWWYDLGTTRGIEATPIVVDGVMYVSITWSRVLALDAVSGELIWSYDPQVPRAWGRKACCDVVNRGVAVWDGAVFVGTIDGRLVSIDAATGERNWEVRTTDPERGYSITGAPRVVKGKVIIGNGGAELGVRGYVTAYDAATGEQVWRFYTVPGNPAEPFEHPEMELAAATWTGEWWKVGGGGTAWDAMAYDPELDLLYVGTGNGAPWTRFERSPEGGDNLFLCAILALRPDTGEMVWYYQTTPGDNWDYTSVQHIVLADLEIDGRLRKVLMQAPKNGFFYVLDRATGELISAEPFIRTNWASGVDPETGRPVETEIGNFDEVDRLIFPGPIGGHNWHPMTYHPPSGLVVIPSMDTQFWYTHDDGFEYRPREWNLAIDWDRNVDLGEEQPPEAAGFLIGWDPVAQKAVWRVPHAGYWNGGTVSTAGGLVFQGTGDGRFVAYDVETGEVLWEVMSQTGIMAPPISYEVDGVQYIAVAAGLGGGLLPGGFLEDAVIARHVNEGRILVFKLGASAAIPPSEPRNLTVPAPPPLEATAAELREGKSTYNRYCVTCHGPSVKSSWVVPDLRYLSPERHAEFEAIVYRGALEGNGMPRFDDIDPAALPALHSYIIGEAQKLYEEQNRPKE